MEETAAECRAAGRKPFVIPLGASTAVGAIGFAQGVAELVAAGHRPDVILSATSSGGTQAGLIAGAALLGLRTRIIGVSADDPASSLASTVSSLLSQMAERLGAKPATIGIGTPVDVDDTQVGAGYGIPTLASIAALELVARTEGILLDPVYTAKAMAGLIDRVHTGAFGKNETVLFWHTGGQVANFA
jgi:1-aminocyclopropane-1-carboxylate deaminase/D-cysteine desulfhydrase-like pyridoxal-dependent ACC family enzyme